VRAPGPSAAPGPRLALRRSEEVPVGEVRAALAVDYEEALRLDDARKSLRLRRGAQTVRGDGGAVSAAPGEGAEVRLYTSAFGYRTVAGRSEDAWRTLDCSRTATAQ